MRKLLLLAVGLWGAFLGGPAIWVLPVAFPLIMAVGGALGVAGLPLPAVEAGIASSAIVLGGAVAAANWPSAACWTPPMPWRNACGPRARKSKP